jgi:CubicO group peptidase (beta-lactamase class C family)
MVLGRLVEKLTGTSLDRAVRDQLTTPLGLTDTGFRPLGWVKDRQRLVATDARRPAGCCAARCTTTSRTSSAGSPDTPGCSAPRGTSRSSGRCCSTAAPRRTADPVRRRRPPGADQRERGKPAIDPDRPHRTSAHGLGLELNQSWFMGRLASPRTFGHTGFTGTSLLVEPRRKLVLVLLSNRAHPNWSWSDPDTHRVALADVVADGLR